MTYKEPMKPEWVTALFLRLRGIYLEKWDRCFHSEDEINAAKYEWSEGLAGITGEQIKMALSYCLNNLDWPPTLPEFIKACRKPMPVHDPLLPKPPKVKPNPENIARVHNMIKEAFKEIE